jgi:hypothetical protein
MALPKKTSMVSLRLPLDTIARLQELADKKGINRHQYIVNILTEAVNAIPCPHEYPLPRKNHVEGDMEVDKYGNAYILVGNAFQYKAPEKLDA